MIFLLKKFILEYKKQKQSLLKEIEFNQKLESFFPFFQKEEEFLNLNIKNFLSFLRDNNFSFYPYEKLETTLSYIQVNNCFLDPNCQTFFKEFLAYLKSLKKDVMSFADYHNLTTRIANLISDLENKNKFIEDIDLVVEILKELDVNSDDIFSCMKEINNHNQVLVGNLEVKKEKKISSTKSYRLSNLDNLKEFGYLNSFSEFEKVVLESASSPILIEKLEFLKNTTDFSFLKEKKYQKILVIILAFANLDDIKNIYKVSQEYHLSLKDILPTTYLKRDFQMPSINLKDDFYQDLVGSYEYFLTSISILKSLGSDIGKEFLENPAFFITPNDLLKYNLTVFKEYNIDVNAQDEAIINALMTNNLVNQLDSFIEAGLLDYVKDHKSILLNKDPGFFYRIYYAKKNNLPIKNRYLRKEITSLDGYGIQADNYLEMVKPYTSHYLEEKFQNLENKKSDINFSNIVNNSLIKLLEDNYLLDDNAYYIANTYISRYKVLRTYQAILNGLGDINYFEGILFAILDKKIVDKDRFDEIVLEVMNLFLINKAIYFDTAVNISRKLGVDYNKIFETFGNMEKGNGR